MSEVLVDGEDFPEIIELSKAIGMTIILWAQIERQFDNWAQIAFYRCDGKKFADEIPQNYKKKIAFLRKCFNQLPVLAEYKEEAIGMMDQAQELVDLRHTFAHASIDSLKPDKDGYFIFRSFRHTKDGHETVLKSFRLIDWPTFFESLMGLQHYTPRLSARLINDFPTGKLSS